MNLADGGVRLRYIEESGESKRNFLVAFGSLLELQERKGSAKD